jgi:translation initiation factor IF-2
VPETKRKIFQIAKELNVASPVIIEFLEGLGFTMPKTPKHMSPVTNEMYEEALKRFDKLRWQQQQESLLREAEDTKRREADKARTEQLRRILDESTTPILEAAEQLIQEVEAQKQEREEKKRKRKAKPALPEVPPGVPEKPTVEAPLAAPPLEVVLPGEKVAEELARVQPPAGPVIEPAITPPVQPVGAVKKEAVAPLPPKKEKPKKPKIPKPTKADLERLEKQRKLLAAQRKDKYKTEVHQLPEVRWRKRVRKKRVDAAEVAATIKATMAAMEEKRRRRRPREHAADTEMVEDETVLHLTEFVTTQELANLMAVPVSDVIRKFLSMGKLVSINQRLERDTIELMADEYGFRVEFVSEMEPVEEEPAEVTAELAERAPVVTVMGHVDHGKTTLLDYLRKSSVAAGEVGGITQHIGAYVVKYKDKKITFLDTPGHEAFTAMRARGAQATDIVVLVVAADDQVRPQTVEAIDHARAAGVPIVVAISKIDKPGAHPDVIRKQLADNNVLVEDWGGKHQFAEISSKTGQGVDKLLSEILVAAEVLELRADAKRRGRGAVIESRLDRGRGVVATVLVQHGTLHIGDNFVCGQHYGKVRAMLDETGNRVESASLSQPVQIIGFSGAPQAGDIFVAFESERETKEIAMRRQLLQREQTFRQVRALSLDQVSQEIRRGAAKELSLIIKGDADGSVEAICDSLQRLSTGEVAVNVLHRGVGMISESDVLLASTTGAIILGFHVYPNIKARETALREKVDIRTYKIIYEMIDDIRNTLEGLLEPETREEVVGLIEVREVFRIPKIGNIAGCFVVSGHIERSNTVRLLRDGREIWKGAIASLRHFKDDVREVKAGAECGIGLTEFDNVAVNDTLEVLTRVEIKRKLTTAS